MEKVRKFRTSCLSQTARRWGQFCCLTAVVVAAVTLLVGQPTSLLETTIWNVPRVPASSTGFAAGTTMRPSERMQARIPRSMADVMQQTQADRRVRYAERGYGWHDPKLGVASADEVAAAVQPLVGEISEMETEIEDEQHEIQGLQSAEQAPPQPAAVRTVRFAIPGSISIDHLDLPSGEYSLSLGSSKQAFLRPSKKDTERAEKRQLASISRPRTQAEGSGAKKDPLDIIADSLSAPARRTQLAMAQVQASRVQTASNLVRKHVQTASKNVKTPAENRLRVKQRDRGKAPASTFHHIRVKGARKAGGHAVAKIVAGMVQAETALTPAERAFAATTIGQPPADLHAEGTRKLRMHRTRTRDRSVESSTNRVQHHQINMINVDKLEQVREASPPMLAPPDTHKTPSPLSLLLDARRASECHVHRAVVPR